MHSTPKIVDFMPQLELLQRAALTLTNADLNTALEWLSCFGLVGANPIANGPARCARHDGAATLRNRSDVWLSLLPQSTQTLQQAIAATGGVARVADIVEQAISSGSPVL